MLHLTLELHIRQLVRHFGEASDATLARLSDELGRTFSTAERRAQLLSA